MNDVWTLVLTVRASDDDDYGDNLLGVYSTRRAAFRDLKRFIRGEVFSIKSYGDRDSANAVEINRWEFGPDDVGRMR